MSATHQYPKFTMEFGGGDKNSKDIDSISGHYSNVYSSFDSTEKASSKSMEIW